MFKLRLNWLRHWIWFQPLGWCLIKYYKLKFFHSSARIIAAELALTEASGWVNKVKSQLNQWEFFKRLFWGLDFIQPSQLKFSQRESCIYSFIHSPTQIAPLNIQVLKYLHKWIYVKWTWFLSLEMSSGIKILSYTSNSEYNGDHLIYLFSWHCCWLDLRVLLFCSLAEKMTCYIL